MEIQDPRVRRELGRLVREARRAARLNQTDFARRAGISQSRVSKIESGKIEARTGQVAKLSEALGLEPLELAFRVFEALSRPVSQKVADLEAEWGRSGAALVARYESVIAAADQGEAPNLVVTKAAVEIPGSLTAEQDRDLRALVREVLSEPEARHLIETFFYRDTRPAIARGFARRSGREAPELCDEAAADWLAPIRTAAFTRAAAEDYRRRFVDVFVDVVRESGTVDLRRTFSAGAARTSSESADIPEIFRERRRRRPGA